MPELTFWGEEGQNQQRYWPHPLDHEWDSPSYDTVRTASPTQCQGHSPQLDSIVMDARTTPAAKKRPRRVSKSLESSLESSPTHSPTHVDIRCEVASHRDWADLRSVGGCQGLEDTPRLIEGQLMSLEVIV